MEMSKILFDSEPFVETIYKFVLTRQIGFDVLDCEFKSYFCINYCQLLLNSN